MQYIYHTKGTCASRIELELDGGVIKNVTFINGCKGSLAGLSRLVVGQPAVQSRDKLAGIPCGPRKTSCPDQLAQAIDEALLLASMED